MIMPLLCLMCSSAPAPSGINTHMAQCTLHNLAPATSCYSFHAPVMCNSSRFPAIGTQPVVLCLYFWAHCFFHFECLTSLPPLTPPFILPKHSHCKCLFFLQNPSFKVTSSVKPPCGPLLQGVVSRSVCRAPAAMGSRTWDTVLRSSAGSLLVLPSRPCAAQGQQPKSISLCFSQLT